MHEGFEGWVRVLCCGPFVYASMTAAALPNTSLALVCGGMAVAFAIWPERLAYTYRSNRFVPFWSKSLSVVDPGGAGNGPAVETFAAYRPRLTNLLSAYFSVSWYVALAFTLWRVPAMRTPFASMVGVALLLWLVSRSET